MNNTAKLVCFGNGGDSVEYGHGCHGSGYGTPERPHASDPTRNDIPDGTPVIDKRPAIDTPEGYRWVFNGPLVDVDLEDDDVERCPQPSTIMASAMAGNSYGSLLTLHAGRPDRAAAGPLDKVSTAVFIRGWRNVGARIGHYMGGEIVWEGSAS